MIEERYGCAPCEIPSPGPATMANMLMEANDLTQKALAMALQIDSQIFGMGPKEREPNDPRCMRDVVAHHLDDLKALCESLDSICRGLGV